MFLHRTDELPPLSEPDLNGSGSIRARVLLADDHRQLLDTIATMLAADFLVVGAVTDGDELVDAVAILNPDVVVVDISMPRVNGLEAAERIRHSGSSVPIVCLTAHEEPEFLRAALAVGILGYVTKAAIARELVSAIHAALEGRSFVSASMTRSRFRN